ncbi:hypothetical protein [Lysobacter xanthus]
MAREFPGGAPASGIGRQGDLDPSTRGADRADSDLGARQAIEGREEDDLAAGSEAEAWLRGARSTPSSADVRSDDMGAPNGEPL